jgi:transposase-like protein
VVHNGGTHGPRDGNAEGEVLDVLVQSRRNKRAALKLMRKLLKKYGFVPDKLVTDDLRSYAAAARVILESQDDMSVVDGATIEPRIRINRPDDENTRCRVSSARGQPLRPEYFQTTATASRHMFIADRERLGASFSRVLLSTM